VIVARTLDPAAHALRRDVFVDSAQRLIVVKGYEQLSVQEVLDAAGASRGAFYHYFDSKAALLESVVERMADDAVASLAGVVTDPNLTALQKLEGVFSGIARWKGERTDLVLAVLQVWFADDNAIVREKFRQGSVTRLAPLLSTIVEQGQAEGEFTTSAPGHVARVLMALILGANEAAVELYFARQAGTIGFEDVEARFAAYGDAFERVLGVAPGSFHVIDPDVLHQWFD
jgi:AcrR family transcriptional regulator